MMGTILPFARTVALMHATAADATEPTADDWGMLMACAQAGDREAYRRLLTAVAPYLRTIARKYFAHREDVDDAVQETLVVVHEIRHTYEPGRPFRPWLSTIATRRCIDLLRRRASRRGVEVADDDTRPEAVDGDVGPQARAEHASTRAHMRRAVDALPPQQRRAIELVHLQGHSLDEAAAASGQTAGSIKVACHRAIKTLRRTLARTEES